MSKEPKKLDSKVKAKIRAKVRRQSELKAEIKKLEDEAKVLSTDLKDIYIEYAIKTFAPSPTEPGYRLDTPEQVVYAQPKWREYLAEHAPKVKREVFVKTETFNKAALEEAIERGDVPEADALLADDEYTTVTEMTPRLMPTKPEAKTDTKGKVKAAKANAKK